MLVLSRRPHQTIVVNENIRITIQAVLPDRVEIGVEAPRTVTAYLGENRAAVVAARRAAAGEPPLSEDALRAADVALFQTPTHVRPPNEPLNAAAAAPSAAHSHEPQFWG